MSAVMASPISPKRAEWQPGHVPRLSYRNPIPPDESLPEHNSAKTGKKMNVPALSIREIREALPRETTPLSSPTTTQPQKSKRPSFLGSIFVKEPSMAALDQVAQSMMQQHNAGSTKAIPYVSQQKMPNHVPKVNSKWDGVPDYVKCREKQEKERVKATRRISLLPSTSRSRSGEIEQQIPRLRRGSNEGSAVESWDSLSSGSRPMFQDSLSGRPPSIYSTSSGGSLVHDSRPFSEISQSSGSFSGMRSLDAGYLYPDETNSHAPELLRLRSAQSTSTRTTISTDRSRSDYSSRTKMSTSETVPDYTSSPAPTPIESSPRTPSYFSVDDFTTDNQISKARPLSTINPQILSIPPSAKKGVRRTLKSDA